MKYYFWHWDESRGDDYDNWGTSDWYYEIAYDESYNRVIQIYQSGDALFFSRDHSEDKYGFLPEGSFGNCEYGEQPISAEAFNKLVEETYFTNVGSVT